MRVYTTVNFEKQFKKLPVRIQEQFEERIRLFLQDSRHPLLRVHALGGMLRGKHAFSVSGDYRVVYRILNMDEIELGGIGTHN